MRELQKLCDKVPSFPNEIAMKLLEEELGGPWSDFYDELGPNPVAAASLGQVYKGKIKGTGEIVAVKVQRPFVLVRCGRNTRRGSACTCVRTYHLSCCAAPPGSTRSRPTALLGALRKPLP